MPSGTSQLNQDCWGWTGCYCHPRWTKGVALPRSPSDSLYRITVSNKLPQTLSRSPWVERGHLSRWWGMKVGSIQPARVGSGLFKKLSQEPTEGLLAAPLSLAYKPENARVLRKSSASGVCEWWVQARETYTPWWWYPEFSFIYGKWLLAD